MTKAKAEDKSKSESKTKAAQPMPTIVKKLTPKDVAGKPIVSIARELAESETVELYHTYGKVVSHKIVPSNTMGDSVKFIGQFEAVNIETGEVFVAAQMFIPSVAGDLLEAAIIDPEINSFEFGFTIGIKEDATAVKGYVYTCKSLVAPKNADALSGLRQQCIGHEA